MSPASEAIFSIRARENRGVYIIFRGAVSPSDVAHLHPTPVALPQQKQAVAMNL